MKDTLSYHKIITAYEIYNNRRHVQTPIIELSKMYLFIFYLKLILTWRTLKFSPRAFMCEICILVICRQDKRVPIKIKTKFSVKYFISNTVKIRSQIRNAAKEHFIYILYRIKNTKKIFSNNKSFWYDLRQQSILERYFIKIFTIIAQGYQFKVVNTQHQRTR